MTYKFVKYSIFKNNDNNITFEGGILLKEINERGQVYLKKFHLFYLLEANHPPLTVMLALLLLVIRLRLNSAQVSKD